MARPSVQRRLDRQARIEAWLMVFRWLGICTVLVAIAMIVESPGYQCLIGNGCY